MDAQLFQDVCDALQNHKCRAKIRVSGSCPVKRVIWSTFDYMSGPLLRFVWEADTLNELTTADSGDETVDGNVSTDSSVSKNTRESDNTIAKNQFEEIDEIFKNDLISTEMDDDLLRMLDNKSLLRPATSTETNSSFTLVNARTSCYGCDDCASSSSNLLALTSTSEQLSPLLRTHSDIDESNNSSNGSTTSANAVIDGHRQKLNAKQQKNEQQCYEDGDNRGSDNCIKINNEIFAAATRQQSQPRISQQLQTQDDDAVLQDVSECTVMSDSGIAATTSMESDLSAHCSSNNKSNALNTGDFSDRPSTSASLLQDNNENFKGSLQNHPIRYRVGSDDCRINLDYSKCPSHAAFVQNIGHCEEVVEDTDASEMSRLRDVLSRMTRCEYNKSEENASLNTSAMINTSSAFFEDDTLCDMDGSNNSGNNVEAAKEAFYREALMLTELNANGGSDCGMALLTDEEFVAKFALAEQIFSPPLSTSPLFHKLTTIPSRRILVGSYIFSLKLNGIRPSAQTSAISIIMPVDFMKWYTKRQKVVEEIFTDMISRFKASYAVESIEDAVCRITREIVSFFELFVALERWPLINTELHTVKATHLWDVVRFDSSNLNFLARAITACLMTKGMCTVVCADSTQLVKMMKTLSLFVNETQHLFCLRPYRLPFSPYLRIQAVKRSELEDVYLAAVDCHWPMAIVDVDRQSVMYSGSFIRHRTVKERALFYQVGQILKESGAELDLRDEKQCAKESHIESHVVRADAGVLEFLEHLSLLPMERVARSAHLDHFHLRLENRARALLLFVEHVSVPAPNDKRSALSAPWNAAAVRRALNLQADAAFAIALAKADEMCTDFAEFFYQNVYRRRGHK